MSKETFISQIPNIKLIAHRLGYHMTAYPENSLSALEYIFKNDSLLNACDGFEFDIGFTKDNIPIVIHDKYIDDISDGTGFLKNFTLFELQKLNFSFRKSLNQYNSKHTFKIVTLEELLIFFYSHITLLKDKIIKIESKGPIWLSKKKIIYLTNLINKFPNLNSHLIHLSFWPQNLIFLKNKQKKLKFKTIKNDLLCENKLLVFLSKFLSLDYISLRIKTPFREQNSNKNSKKVNKKINSDRFFMNHSNSLNEKNLIKAIKRYGTVGLYVLNNDTDLDSLCQVINLNILKQYSSHIYITTDNPLYLKNKHYN